MINQLLLRLPSQCVLVIESRAVPNLDYAGLLSRDEIVGFDGTFLHFTVAEIQEPAALRGVTSLRESEAVQLATLFDGWITGILLGTRLGNKRLLGVRSDPYIPGALAQKSLGLAIGVQNRAGALQEGDRIMDVLPGMVAPGTKTLGFQPATHRAGRDTRKGRVLGDTPSQFSPAPARERDVLLFG